MHAFSYSSFKFPQPRYTGATSYARTSKSTVGSRGSVKRIALGPGPSVVRFINSRRRSLHRISVPV